MWTTGDEETPGEGGQKDCRGWGALERDTEGDEEGVMLPLALLLVTAW